MFADVYNFSKTKVIFTVLSYFHTQGHWYFSKFRLFCLTEIVNSRFFPLEFSWIKLDRGVSISIKEDANYIFNTLPTFFPMSKKLYPPKLVVLPDYNCKIFSFYLTIVIIRKENCGVEVVEGTERKEVDSIFLIYQRNRNKRRGKKNSMDKFNSPLSPKRTHSLQSRYNSTSFIPLSHFLLEAQKCMLNSRGDGFPQASSPQGCRLQYISTPVLEGELCVFLGYVNGQFQNFFQDSFTSPSTLHKPTEGLLLQIYKSLVSELWDKESGTLSCVCACMCTCMHFVLNLVHCHYRTTLQLQNTE